MKTELISLIRPEYLLKPKQLIRRFNFVRDKNSKKEDLRQAFLAWNSTILTRSVDKIGDAIFRMALYDLCLTELLWRLVDEGDLALDVGANIGYASNVMAQRVGKAGRIIAFEPHPEVYSDLNCNIELWKEKYHWNQIESHRIAISDYEGEGQLNIPPDFPTNRGMAHFYEEGDKPPDTLGEISVKVTTLDSFASKNELGKIGCLKIDVEGHEWRVIKGAAELLKTQNIRDIIFEDSCFAWRDTEKTQELYQSVEKQGYSLFRVLRSTLRPLVESIGSNNLPKDLGNIKWEPPSYVATRDAERFTKRMKRFGWHCLF